LKPVVRCKQTEYQTSYSPCVDSSQIYLKTCMESVLPQATTSSFVHVVSKTIWQVGHSFTVSSLFFSEITVVDSLTLGFSLKLKNIQCMSYSRAKQPNKLHGLSPRANYTDRATTACQRSDCQLLWIEGATWSA
jgi:hypothetical protein